MEGSPLTNYIHVVTVFVIRLYIFLAFFFEEIFWRGETLTVDFHRP